MRPFLSLFITALTLSSFSQAHELVKKWQTPATFATPESVRFSAPDKALYVSNIGNGQDPWLKDGNGSIAKVDLAGKVTTEAWIKGLDAPKGLAIHTGKLYIADISKVVIVDIAQGVIEKSIEIENTTGLNDITVDPAGIVYVSEFKSGKIYAITDGKPALFIDGLKTPNGLLAQGDLLYVLDSGSLWVTTTGPKVKLTEVITGLDGSTDGIEHISGDEFIISCWSGVIYHVNITTHQKEILLDTREAKINSADIGYDATTRTLYVPTFFAHTVAAYELK